MQRLTLSASSLSARDKLQFAQQNVKAFEQATAELITAQTSKDHIRGLTKSIRAVENALSIVRENLRVIAKKKRKSMRLFSQRKISRGCSALFMASIKSLRQPPHPSPGPLTTAGGMLLADILPKLQAPVERFTMTWPYLKGERLRRGSRGLKNGAQRFAKARTDLSVALANRGHYQSGSRKIPQDRAPR